MIPRTIPIPEALRPYIRHALLLDCMDAGYNGSHTCFPIVADGYPGILLHLSDKGLFLNEEKTKLSEAFLYGQTVAPITLSTDGPFRMMVISFHPHVMQPVFRFNAHELTDDCIDIELLPDAPRVNLAEQLVNIAAPDKQVAALFTYLEKLVAGNHPEPDKGLRFATGQIIQSNGAVPLKELQRKLNLSERTFERRFEQYVGISPKTFAKIAQFQAALRQMSNKDFSKLSDIAYDNGYADQSHFIRSFKKFTGHSPLSFRKQPHTVFQNFPALIV